MLSEMQRVLCGVITDGNDAALHVIGATRTGKSHCLLGPNKNLTEMTGIVRHFAEAYYAQFNSEEAAALIELAIFLVQDEQVFPLVKYTFIEWNHERSMIYYIH